MGTDKKIKIFVDAHCFDTQYQGTQSFLLQLYTALLQHYPQLDIYMGAYYTNRIQAAFPLLPTNHILPYKSLRPAALRFVTDIPRLLKQQAFDFAHFQYIAPWPVKGCKFIVTLHDVLFNDFPHAFPWGFRQSRNKLFGGSIKRATVKTTVSTYAKQRIMHHYGVPDAELHLVPNAIPPLPTDILDKTAARQQIKERFGIENFILYVSRLEPRKNHLLLLKAWLECHLYRQGIALVFVGSRNDATGSKSAPLLKAMQQLPANAKPFFHHIEQVERDTLPLFLQAARLFVYPSLAEGFGIPPLEAAVAGTPVLCSKATAMQDFTFFGKGLFDPHDKQELKDKMDVMLNHPPSASELSAIANQVQQQYAPQHSAAVFYQLLTQYLA
jgi:glycosyltransferase involved in cell wall biosynthesis